MWVKIWSLPPKVIVTVINLLNHTQANQKSCIVVNQNIDSESDTLTAAYIHIFIFC